MRSNKAHSAGDDSKDTNRHTQTAVQQRLYTMDWQRKCATLAVTLRWYRRFWRALQDTAEGDEPGPGD